MSESFVDDVIGECSDCGRYGPAENFKYCVEHCDVHCPSCWNIDGECEAEE